MKTIFIFLLSVIAVQAKHQHPERWYQEHIAKKWNAKIEVKVTNGRVDIVGKKYATEVEFADKWKNAIGQALWYSIQTNKKPAIVLICETPEDYLHAIRLRSTIKHAKLDIKVWTHDEILGGNL